jgi:enolase-phosphatase E1
MIRAIVTDIEGTTSSISFVKEVLFPYARERMEDFVCNHLDDMAVRQALDDVDNAVGRLLNVDEAVAQLIAWIDEDRKITPLKNLQGMIWEAGYREGDFHGHVYPDAVEGLRRWQAAGIDLYVYSSGSVQAQKLLFGHTEAGDLTALFNDYFDTRIGAKVQADSYRRITDQVGVPAAEILFLSDLVEELDAAAEAGMQTLCLVREGGAGPGNHPVARHFGEIEVG